jgi:hypothetical protein
VVDGLKKLANQKEVSDGRENKTLLQQSKAMVLANQAVT